MWISVSYPQVIHRGYVDKYCLWCKGGRVLSTGGVRTTTTRVLFLRFMVYVVRPGIRVRRVVYGGRGVEGPRG
jgi:hypothetical protein